MNAKNIALGTAAFFAGAIALVVGAATLGRRQDEGHAAPDLAGDTHPDGYTRAPEAFRPDPTAVPTAEEREALRPATGPATGFAADRGSTING